MSDPSVKILLIESDAKDARLICDLLARSKRVHFTVESLPTLAAGLDRLKAGGIDTVLIALPRPDGLGLEVLARIGEQAPGLAVVVLCDLAHERLASQAVLAGAQDYLIKDDLELGILEHAVRYAVGRKRADDELAIRKPAIARWSRPCRSTFSARTWRASWSTPTRAT